MSETSDATQIPIYGMFALPGRRLIHHLKDAKVGDRFLDEDLREIAQVGNMPDEYWLGLSLRVCNYVARNFGKNIKREAKAKTLKCLDPMEQDQVSRGDIRSIGRKTRRTLTRQRNALAIASTDEERRSLLATSAALGTMELFTRKATMARIEERNVTTPIDSKRLIEFMRGKDGTQPDETRPDPTGRDMTRHDSTGRDVT